jgi:hypothetical protein
MSYVVSCELCGQPFPVRSARPVPEPLCSSCRAALAHLTARQRDDEPLDVPAVSRRPRRHQ